MHLVGFLFSSIRKKKVRKDAPSSPSIITPVTLIPSQGPAVAAVEMAGGDREGGEEPLPPLLPPDFMRCVCVLGQCVYYGTFSLPHPHHPAFPAFVPFFSLFLDTGTFYVPRLS
jgi:hypothetical protein